jgi:hypothetical protein
MGKRLWKGTLLGLVFAASPGLFAEEAVAAGQNAPGEPASKVAKQPVEEEEVKNVAEIASEEVIITPAKVPDQTAPTAKVGQTAAILPATTAPSVRPPAASLTPPMSPPQGGIDQAEPASAPAQNVSAPAVMPPSPRAATRMTSKVHSWPKAT